MRKTCGCVVLLLLLPPRTGGATPPPTPASNTWHYLTRLEASALVLLPRTGVLGTGGTLLLPQADGTLRPGAFASLGLGVDNAR